MTSNANSSPPKKHRPEVSATKLSTNSAKSNSNTTSKNIKKKKSPTVATNSSSSNSNSNNKNTLSNRIVIMEANTSSRNNHDNTENTSTRQEKTKVNPTTVPPISPTKHKKIISTAAQSPVQDKEEELCEDQDRKKKRLAFILIGVCCCLLVILILGLVLGLVVFNDNEQSKSSAQTQSGVNGQGSSGNDSGNSGSGSGNPFLTFEPNSFPTSAPVVVVTRAPSPLTSSPSPRPTTSRPTTPRPTDTPGVVPTSLLQPTSSQLVILPFADTYVQRNGFDQGKFASYGDDNTFLVQNGPDGVNEIPDAVGLLAFDISNIPSSFSKIVLRLYHQSADRNRGAATLTVRLLPSTVLDIESLHAGLFNPDDTEGTFGPTFSVAPSDTTVQVDLTNLVRNNANTDELFLMLENRGSEQGVGAEGDRFYTRETTDPPQLVVSNYESG